MSKQAVYIRSATSADIPIIAKIHIESSRIGYRGILPDEMLDKLDLKARVLLWNERFASFGSESRVWIAEITGQASGFCTTGPIASRNDKSSAEVYEIYSLYSRPKYWGMGVGQKLLEWSINDLRSRKVKRIILWTMLRNLRAQRLYKAMGFVDDHAVRHTERMEDDLKLEYDEMRYTITFADLAHAARPHE